MLGMTRQTATLEDARRFYASMLAVASKSSDPRLERVFEAVPREAFLPPGPWTIYLDGGQVKTPTADPIHLYQNLLVVLDAAEGINNGEPFLHAAWIGAVAPQPGEHVTQIGAGTGYYTAMLSMLVLPDGEVTAFELHPGLAKAASRNLSAFDNIEVRNEDAVETDIPPSDLIYVNAGVVAPPAQWLLALRPGGRLIFPWRPSPDFGLAAIVTRTAAGFEFQPLIPSFFIPCVGASDESATIVAPDRDGAWRTKSVWLKRDKVPDASATAVYKELWFSDAVLAGDK